MKLYEEGFEKYFKQGILHARMQGERAATGRMYAHFKHIEMRNKIMHIRKQEGTYKEQLLTLEEQVERIIKGTDKGEDCGGTEINVNDDFMMPFGFGFDHIIKERSDYVNNLKTENNQMMDKLVEKLGYLDYRDALACNRFILEAKQDGDYHQKARAKTLSIAFSRMTKLKREQIEKKVNQKVKGTKLDKEDEKLKMVMDE